MSISLDELVIGFTLGLLQLPVITVVALIASQTVIVTHLGLRLGHRIGERLHEQGERLAGVAPTVLGSVLLAEQVLA